VPLKSFIKWHKHLLSEKEISIITKDQWRELNHANYKVFTATLGMGQVHVKESPSNQPQYSTRVINLAADFKKGTKRDAALYPVLKDNKHWSNWNRSVLAQLQAHDLKEIFNTTYQPFDEEDKKIFTEKQCFAYALLNQIVQTDEGKSFVRQLEKEYDAQAVYKKLLNFATKSSAAKLAKDALVKFLTTTSLDSRLSGSTVGFILHWNKQMRLLDEMSVDEDRFCDGVKKRMLESAVENIPELLTIKDIDTNQATIGGTLMTFSEYKDTLLAVATKRNERLKPGSARTKHVVQNTNLAYKEGNADWFGQGYMDAGETYIDMDAFDPVLVHRAFQCNSGNKNNNQGSQIPKEVRDKLPPELQAKIRELNRNRAFQHKPRVETRTANMHNTTVYSEDFDDDNGETNGHMTDVMPIEKEKEAKNEEDANAILAYIAKQKPLPLTHNLCSILASTQKQSEANNHSPGSTHNKASGKAKNSLVIDGKRYKQIDKLKLH
jgi:hypothetical protein